MASRATSKEREAKFQAECELPELSDRAADRLVRAHLHEFWLREGHKAGTLELVRLGMTTVESNVGEPWPVLVFRARRVRRGDLPERSGVIGLTRSRPHRWAVVSLPSSVATALEPCGSPQEPC